MTDRIACHYSNNNDDGITMELEYYGPFPTLESLVKWNTSQYFGRFDDDQQILINLGYKSPGIIRYSSDQISFKILLINPFQNKSLMAQNIKLLYWVRNYYVNLQDNWWRPQLIKQFTIKVINKVINIMRNSLNRFDNNTADEYEILVNLDLDQTKLYSEFFKEDKFYRLQIISQDLAESWAINQVITQQQLSLDYSCQINLSQNQCYSCPENSLLQNGTCECIKNTQRVFLYKEFEQLQCMSDKEQFDLTKNGDYQIPSIGIQKLVHYFKNSQFYRQNQYSYYMENWQKQLKAQISYSIDTFTQLQVEELDYSQLIITLEMQNGGYPFYRIYIQDDSQIYQKYGVQAQKKNLYCSKQQEQCQVKYEQLQFNDSVIQFEWINKNNYKIVLFLDNLLETVQTRMTYDFLLNFYYLSHKSKFHLLQTNFFQFDMDILLTNKDLDKTLGGFVLDGLDRDQTLAQAYICTDITCNTMKESRSLKSYPYLNYMKIFLANPTLNYVLNIEEITYNLNDDSFFRYMVISVERRLNFRKNEIIIGFIINSDIYQDDEIKLAIKANYEQNQDQSGLRSLDQKVNELKTLQKQFLVQNEPEEQSQIFN